MDFIPTLCRRKAYNTRSELIPFREYFILKPAWINDIKACIQVTSVAAGSRLKLLKKLDETTATSAAQQKSWAWSAVISTAR